MSVDVNFIAEIVFLATMAGLVCAAVWGAWILRRNLREWGELIAKQSERPETGAGESGETYDVEQKADKDPR